MALSFPSSPLVGDQYTAIGNTWTWDGVSWNLVRIPTGPTGATGPTGGGNWSLIATANTTSGSVVNFTGISGKNELILVYDNVWAGASNGTKSVQRPYIRLNGDTNASNYEGQAFFSTPSTFYFDYAFFNGSIPTMNGFYYSSGYIHILNANSTSTKGMIFSNYGSLIEDVGGGYPPQTQVVTARYLGGSTVSSINITLSGSTVFTSGQWRLYGA